MKNVMWCLVLVAMAGCASREVSSMHLDGDEVRVCQGKGTNAFDVLKEAKRVCGGPARIKTMVPASALEGTPFTGNWKTDPIHIMCYTAACLPKEIK